MQWHVRNPVKKVGSDEFAIPMPAADKPQANALCRNLCETIPGKMRATGFNASASIGCSVFVHAP